MKRIFNVILSFLFAFSIAYVVFIINRSFRNPFEVCFEISAMIFANIFIGFLCYFFVYDLFANRWKNNSDYSEEIITKNLYFPVETEITETNLAILQDELIPSSGDNQTQKIPRIPDELYTEWQDHGLYFEMNHHKDLKFVDKKNQIIVFLHGMGNNSQYIRYFTNALALNGYIVFSYDARGAEPHGLQIKKTKLGNKASFISRNQDLRKIVNFLLEHPYYIDYSLNLIGESMGGISAISASLSEEFLFKIDKIIAISVMSDFNRVFSRISVPFTNAWFTKLKYRLKGINLHPPKKINEKISPAFLIPKAEAYYKKQKRGQSWDDFINNKIILIHSKSDKLFKKHNLAENAKLLKLRPENIIEFEKGGHIQIRNELSILGVILNSIEKDYTFSE